MGKEIELLRRVRMELENDVGELDGKLKNAWNLQVRVETDIGMFMRQVNLTIMNLTGYDPKIQLFNYEQKLQEF